MKAIKVGDRLIERRTRREHVVITISEIGGDERLITMRALGPDGSPLPMTSKMVTFAEVPYRFVLPDHASA